VIECKQQTAAGRYDFRNEHFRFTALVIKPFCGNTKGHFVVGTPRCGVRTAQRAVPTLISPKCFLETSDVSSPPR
jgi:hypothetical protein